MSAITKRLGDEEGRAAIDKYIAKQAANSSGLTVLDIIDSVKGFNSERGRAYVQELQAKGTLTKVSSPIEGSKGARVRLFVTGSSALALALKDGGRVAQGSMGKLVAAKTVRKAEHTPVMPARRDELERIRYIIGGVPLGVFSEHEALELITGIVSG